VVFSENGWLPLELKLAALQQQAGKDRSGEDGLQRRRNRIYDQWLCEGGEDPAVERYSASGVLAR